MRYVPGVKISGCTSYIYTWVEIINEEPCGKSQGINSHITNTAAATLWQATGNPQVDAERTRGYSVYTTRKPFSA